MKKFISLLLTLTLIATSFSCVVFADASATPVISNSQNTLIEFEDYIEEIISDTGFTEENKVKKQGDSKLSGSFGAAIYIGYTEATPVTVTIPVSVTSGGKYKVDFATLKYNDYLSDVTVDLVNAEGKKISLVNNKAIDKEICTPIQYQTVYGYSNGGVEKYIPTGEYDLTITLKKAVMQNNIIAILDFIKFVPVSTKLSSTADTVIEFEDYQSYFSDMIGCGAEVTSTSLSGGKGVHLYKEPHTDWPIEILIPINVPKDGFYKVTINASGGGGAANTDVYLVPQTGSETRIATTWGYGADWCYPDSVSLGTPSGGYAVQSGGRNYAIPAGNHQLKINIGKTGGARDVIFTTLDCIKFTPLPDVELGDWTTSDDSITDAKAYSLTIPFTRNNPSSTGYYMVGAMMDKNGNVETKYYDIDTNIGTGSSVDATLSFDATADTAKIYAAVIKDITNPTLVSDIKEITNSSVSVTKGDDIFTVSTNALTKAANGALVFAFSGTEADIANLKSFEYKTGAIAQGSSILFNLKLSGKASDYRALVAAYGADKKCIDNTLYRLGNPAAEENMKTAFAALVSKTDKSEFMTAYEAFVKAYMVDGADSHFGDVYGTEAPISEMTVYDGAAEDEYGYSDIKDYVFALVQCYKDSTKEIANNLTYVNDIETLFKASLFAYVMHEDGGNEAIANKYGSLLAPVYTSSTNYANYKALLGTITEVTADNVYNNMLNAGLREMLIRSTSDAEKEEIVKKLSTKGLLGVDTDTFGPFLTDAVKAYTFNLANVTGDALKNGLTTEVKRPKNLVKAVSPEEGSQYVSDFSTIRIDFVANVKADTLNAENITIDGVTLTDANFEKGANWLIIKGLDKLLRVGNTYNVKVSENVSADYLDGIKGIVKQWSFRTSTSKKIDTAEKTTIEFEEYISSVIAPATAKEGSSAEGHSSKVLDIAGVSSGTVLEVPINVQKTGVYIMQVRGTWPQSGAANFRIKDSSSKQLLQAYETKYENKSGHGTIYAGSAWRHARIWTKPIYLEKNSNEVLNISVDVANAKIGLDYISFTPVEDVVSGDWSVTLNSEKATAITENGTYALSIPFNFYRPNADDKYYVIAAKADKTGKTELSVEEYSNTESYTDILEENEKTFTANVTADANTERIYAAVVKNLDNPYLVSDVVEIKRELEGNKHSVTYSAETDKLTKDASAVIALAFKPGATTFTKANLYCFDYAKNVEKDSVAKFTFVNPNLSNYGTSKVKLAAFDSANARISLKDAECYMVDENAIESFITSARNLTDATYASFVSDYILATAPNHSKFYKGETVEEITTLEQYNQIAEHVIMLKDAIVNGKLDTELNTAQDVANIFKGALFTYNLFNNNANAEALSEKYGALISPLYTENTSFADYKDLLVVPTELTWQNYYNKLLSAALRTEMLTATDERRTEIINKNAEVLGINLTELTNIAPVAQIVAAFDFSKASLAEGSFYTNIKATANSIPINDITPILGGSSSNSSVSGGIKPSFGPIVPDTATSNAVFGDLASHEWAKDAIESLYEKGIISGNGNGGFEPERAVKREEMIKMLCEIFELTSKNAGGNELEFADVSLDDWYYPYIKAAFANEVVNGVNDTNFGVGDNVSRQDVAAMIYRCLQVKKLNTVVFESDFADSDMISDYAKIPVAAMQKYGVITGFEDGSFAPHASATRAEAAVMLQRLMAYMEGAE